MNNVMMTFLSNFDSIPNYEKFCGKNISQELKNLLRMIYEPWIDQNYSISQFINNEDYMDNILYKIQQEFKNEDAVKILISLISLSRIYNLDFPIFKIKEFFVDDQNFNLLNSIWDIYKIDPTYSLNVLNYYLSDHHKVKNIENWRSEISLRNCSPIFIFVNDFYINFVKNNKDLFIMYVKVCSNAFIWRFEENEDILKILKNIFEILNYIDHYEDHSFLILYDFLTKRFSNISTPHIYFGFSFSGVKLILEILLRLIEVIEVEKKVIIKTLEQIILVCLIEQRSEYNILYLEKLPLFLDRTNFFDLFSIRFFSYISHCISLIEKKDFNYAMFSKISAAMQMKINAIMNKNDEKISLKIFIRLLYMTNSSRIRIKEKEKSVIDRCLLKLKTSEESQEFFTYLKEEEIDFYNYILNFL